VTSTVALVAITAGETDDDRLAALCDALAPGALAIQVRGPTLGGAALYALAVRVVAVARPRGAEVWVNDRLDVALAVGADGVHLPERGFDVATARAVAAGRGARLAIGVSRHAATVEDAADRVHLGPIWGTPSKAGMGEPLGVPVLVVARPRVRGTLVAVGGIDGPSRAQAAAAAGADAVAVIRALWTASDLAAVARALVDAVRGGQRVAVSHGTP